MTITFRSGNFHLLFLAMAGISAAPLHASFADPVGSAPAGATPANASATSTSSDGPAAGCGAKAQEGFTSRLYDSYVDHLSVTGEETSPEPAHRDSVPPPLNSPPFPSATWNLGGTPPIGYEGMTYGSLMDAIYCGPDGQAIKDNRITVYGWLEPSYNFSTSKTKFSTSTGSGGNNPAAYAVYPNSVQLDQATLYIERVPDTVQTDHIDWGFRVTNLWGTDYKYTFADGIFSQQYLDQHRMYGYDPVMAYGDLYIPYVADGMNIRVGRYISIPDIEAQLAPDNYTFSHSLLYTVDPYTQTGVVDTIKLNKNWLVQFELSGGNDVAIWNSHAKLAPAVCVSWTSNSGNDNIYPCANTIDGATYGYNNINMPVVTWYHKFNSKWHMATESWYMWETDVPSVTNPNAPSLIQGANGAYCKAGAYTCTASEYAVINYIEYQIAPLDFISVRNGFLNDEQGQRTGYPTRYSEHEIGWTHWIGDAITIRPEILYDHSYNVPAFDNGNKDSQVMVMTDVIFHY